MLSALLTCTLPDMENLLDTSRILDYQNKNFLSSPDCALRQAFVTIVYPVRTAASQAAKTSSNLVGDATFPGIEFGTRVKLRVKWFFPAILRCQSS